MQYAEHDARAYQDPAADAPSMGDLWTNQQLDPWLTSSAEGGAG